LKVFAAFIIGFIILVNSKCGQGQKNEPNRLFPVSQNDKNGYIDRTGEIVVPLKFDGASDFSEGLAAVKVEGKWGFIDEAGRVVIEPQFSGAYELSEGLARVQVGGDKFGYYDKWGFIDKSGNMVIAPQYGEMENR
jgi:WG containing repeat